jgi:hypothetical protein
MPRFVFALGLLMTLSAAGAARAQSTGVFPVVGTNLSARESASIGALLAAAYAEQTRTSVLTPEEVAPVLARAGTQTRAAEQLELYEYVHVQAVRLESRIVLYAELRDTHGRSLFEVRDTAFSLDDMELVSQRMAAALATRAGALAQRGPPRRAHTEKLFGARFALVMPQARRLETQASLLGQFDVRLERNRYFIELAAGFWLPSQTNARQGLGGFVGHVGASYYLLQDSSVSPYIGLGVSPRWFAGEYKGPGLALNAHVGVMFMREAPTRLYAELRVDQNLMRARSRDRDAEDAREVLATELSIAVGLGF